MSGEVEQVFTRGVELAQTPGGGRGGVEEWVAVCLRLGPSQTESTKYFGAFWNDAVGENRELWPRPFDLSAFFTPFLLIAHQNSYKQIFSLEKSKCGAILLSDAQLNADNLLSVAAVDPEFIQNLFPQYLHWVNSAEDVTTIQAAPTKMYQWWQDAQKGNKPLDEFIASLLADAKNGLTIAQHERLLQSYGWLETFLGYAPRDRSNHESAFLLSMLFHLSVWPWQRLYFFPLREGRHEDAKASNSLRHPPLTAGCIVSSANRLPRQTLLEIANAVNGMLFPAVLRYQQQRLEGATRRAAVAGIMARNMSHNLGSHVLAAPGLLNRGNVDDGILFDRTGRFHQFLEERMNFIGQAVSFTPGAGEPTDFVHELLKGFFDQQFLLKHLTRDQGYEDLRFVVHLPGRERPLVYRRKINSSDEDWMQGGDAEPPPHLLVSIPGGVIGRHAFYDIMENVLRNAAKYGRTQAYLEFHIEIAPAGADAAGGSERYQVTLWDNLNRAHDSEKECKPHDGFQPDCVCRLCRVAESFLAPLINLDAPELSVSGRGIKEIRECGRMLAHPYAGWGKSITNTFAPLPVWPGKTRRSPAVWGDERETNDTAAEYLSTNFFLQKPHFLGVLHDEAAQGKPTGEQNPTTQEKSAEQERHGIRWNLSLESLTKNPPQIAVIFLPARETERKELLSAIAMMQRRMSYRLLLASPEAVSWRDCQREMETVGAVMPPRRAVWCDRAEAAPIVEALSRLAHETGEAAAAAGEDAILRSLTLYLRKAHPAPDADGAPYILAINLAREQGEDDSGSFFDGWSTQLLDAEMRYPELAKLVQVVLLRTTGQALHFENGMEAALGEAVSEGKGRLLLYDNHGAAQKVGKAFGVWRDAAIGFYHEFGSKNLPLFNAITHPPSSVFGFLWLLFGLLETALTRVVIVDERVAEAALASPPDETQWGRAGVFPVTQLFLSDSNPQKRSDVKPQLGAAVTSEAAARAGRFGLRLSQIRSGDALRSERSLTQRLGDASWGQVTGERTLATPHIIVIHYGIKERLKTKQEWLTEEQTGAGLPAHLSRLFDLAPRVVATSGRGNILEHAWADLPFIDFSGVQTNTYFQFSKYHLTRALLSAVGETK